MNSLPRKRHYSGLAAFRDAGAFMRQSSIILPHVLFAFLIAGSLSAVYCQDNLLVQPKAGAVEPGIPQSETLTYKPPMRGAPAGGGRIAAAVRGNAGDVPVLLVCAPDHVGLTSEKQPVLYWYIPRPVEARIEFTLNDEQKDKTLIKADLPVSKVGSMQAIKLSDYQMLLSPGVVYRWFVTMEADPDQPSKDVYDGGSIMYQEPQDGLKKMLSMGGDIPKIYASEGFWYDAFAASMKPGRGVSEKLAKQYRTTLLKDVGYGVAEKGKLKSTLDGENEMLRMLAR